ncbi:hypothetical protein AUP68_05712 [Ilyonectria robusta]
MEHLRMHLHVSVTDESPSTVRYPACKSVPWCVCLVRVISSRPLWNKRIYAQRAHDSGPGGVVTQVRAASPVTAARLLLCCRRDRRRKTHISQDSYGLRRGSRATGCRCVICTSGAKPTCPVPRHTSTRPWLERTNFSVCGILGRTDAVPLAGPAGPQPMASTGGVLT